MPYLICSRSSSSRLKRVPMGRRRHAFIYIGVADGMSIRTGVADGMSVHLGVADDLGHAGIPIGRPRGQGVSSGASMFACLAPRAPFARYEQGVKP